MDANTLQMPSDEKGFSRRECPRCHAHFKVRTPARDDRLVALALAIRIAHLNAGEISAAPETRHCPYCGARAPADGWWTAEQQRYLEERATSLSDELRSRRMQAPFESLGSNPSPTYVPLPPFEQPRDPPPIRAEARDDLVTLTLPCCGIVQKVTDAWTGPVRCHFCGAVHSRTASRDFGLEMALLREWTESR